MQQRGAPRPWERLARSSTPLEGISYNDARTANEYEKAELARLKRWQLGGELIERKRRSVSSSAWQRQIRDAWPSWPGQVGPQITAHLGLEEYTGSDGRPSKAM